MIRPYLVKHRIKNTLKWLIIIKAWTFALSENKTLIAKNHGIFCFPNKPWKKLRRLFVRGRFSECIHVGQIKKYIWARFTGPCPCRLNLHSNAGGNQFSKFHFKRALKLRLCPNQAAAGRAFWLRVGFDHKVRVSGRVRVLEIRVQAAFLS